ncbi:MAG: hypothetical protein WD314_03155 [Trueperaceae bacterium]
MKRLVVLILVLAVSFGLADPDRPTDPVVNSADVQETADAD